MTSRALVKRGAWLLVASFVLLILAANDTLVATSNGADTRAYDVLAEWLSQLTLVLGAGLLVAAAIVSSLSPKQAGSADRPADWYS